MRNLRLLIPCSVLALVGGGCADDSNRGTGTTFTTSDTDATTTDGSTSGVGTTTGMATTATTGATDSDSGTTGGSTGGTTGDGVCDDVDEPDVNGLDENMDGIDGVLCRAVFVKSNGGSDLNEGLLPDEPVQTIAKGIEIAGTYDPPRMVLVSGGTYDETVVMNSGVSVYGGYDGTFGMRNIPNNATIIEATENRAVRAENLAEATEIDGFTINAFDYSQSTAGESSYGVWVKDTPDGLFTVDYCTIQAGAGGAGADGAPGDPGSPGEVGDPASGSNGGEGGASACGATGGAGGSGNQCPSTDGTDGMAGGDPVSGGAKGLAGQSQCGSNCDDSGANADPGNDGDPGQNGDGGLASTAPLGVFDSNGLWIGSIGTDATRGFHGTGGGGGGAGGYDVDPQLACAFIWAGDTAGGGGGGGGSAGCGGDGGTVGQTGGGAFGIVVVNSAIAVTNTDIVQGTGGDGGDGGDGGAGGSAGTGGAGANASDNEGGDGRAGGDGGVGGGGGGGSGGCGGVAVGIALVANSMAAKTNVSTMGGTAGSGGLGGKGGMGAAQFGTAEDGAAGCNGVVQDEHTY